MPTQIETVVDLAISKAVIFDTPLMTPESPNVPLNKALILGVAKILVKYVADVPNQQVHAAHFEIPFYALQEWPNGPREDTPLCIEPVLEKSETCLKEGRTLETLILVHLNIRPQ